IEGGGSQFTVRGVEVRLAMAGRHQALNAAAALAAGDFAGVSVEAGSNALAGVKVEHRLEEIPTPGGYSIIDDAYNASPESKSAAGRPRPIFGAHATHLRCCGLRSSLTNPRMRSLWCSAAPSIWAAWAPNLSPMNPAALFDVGTFVVGFAIAIVLYPFAIRALRRIRSGQVIQDELPDTHQRKAGTPTGGGILFVGLAILGG